MMNAFEELVARGLVDATTHENQLQSLLSEKKVAFYLGQDPTAPSLHLGNLVPLAMARVLQSYGHKPIVLVGGATGMIGDPSGKSKERNLQSGEDIQRNVECLAGQLHRLLDFAPATVSSQPEPRSPAGALLVDNHQWFRDMGFLEFLRDIGKHLSVNYMTAKESVKNRLADDQKGISFTEFSYMLLQAYDFVHLADHYGCQLQIGGSDQWGNITAGTELYRKRAGKLPLFGMTCPLLVDKNGQKMGKTQDGEKLWVDATLTSPYAFYQYFLNVTDSDAPRLLGMFALSLTDLEEWKKQHTANPQKRILQKQLAKDIVTWVHGADMAARVEKASAVLFGGAVAGLTDDDLLPLLSELPSITTDRQTLDTGLTLIELLIKTSLASSKSEAKRLIKGGGVYVNNKRQANETATISTQDLATESLLIVRAGKKNYRFLRVE